MGGAGSLPPRAWAEIDLGAIARNFRAFRERVGPAVAVCAVVKADGYGHGAVPVARRLLAEAGDRALWLGVADAREAAELRRDGIAAPILILGALTPDEAGAAVEHDLSVTVHSTDEVSRLHEAAAKSGRRVRVHVKVDTGMGRLGVAPAVAWPLAERVRASSALVLEGVSTHLSSAGSMNEGAVREQLKAFRTALEQIRRGGDAGVAHAANGAAALAFPETRFDLVRPGLVLYGIDPGCCARLGWRPEAALSLRSRVLHVKPLAQGRPVGYERSWHAPRDTRVAAVPLGYADGYPFALANRGEALVRGRRAPVVGSVTMDYVMLDVGGIPEAGVGDVVTFIGKDGEETIRAEDVASKAGTIPYEIVCRIGARVERVYGPKAGF